MKKIIAFIVVIAVVGGAGLFLKKQKEAVAHLQKPKNYLHSVDVTFAKTKEVQERREFLAEVQASDSAFIASKFAANIKKIYVNENDAVKKGDLLISLDDKEILANLNSLKEQRVALQADSDNAKTVLDRNKKLFAIAAISQEAYDASLVMYKNKRAALHGVEEKIKQTQAQLRYLNIRAPFSGRVGSKLADEGSLAIAAKPLITLNSADQKLLFSFVDTDKPIMPGQKVYIDGKLIGTIAKRYDNAKNGLLVAEVKPLFALPFANHSYKTVSVVVASATGCSVATNALVHKKDGIYVMVYKGGRFHARKVDVLLVNESEALLESCPKAPVAVASEAKLSILPTYGEVLIDEGRE